MLVRGPSLAASMSYYLIQQIADIENIKVRTSTEIVCGHGDEHLEGLTLRDNVSGDEEKVETGLLFCFIGAAPRTDWLDGATVRDKHGFVVAGPDLVIDGQRPAGLAAGPGSVPPGDQHSRRVRRRRRPGRLRQAGGLRGRRGRHGRHAGAPIPGEAMTTFRF